MPRRSSSRICAAPDCPHSIPATRLMCRRHWFTLPPALRSAIETTARLGPRATYLENVRAAERMAGGAAASA